MQYLVPRLPEVHRISVNLDQWYDAGVIGCRTPSEFEDRRVSGNYLMSALLELRKLLLNRATFVISDAQILFNGHIDDKIDLVQYRWTLAEKQVWARYVRDSILQKDNPRAMSSSLTVECDTKDGNTRLGLESHGEKKRERKPEVEEEDGATTEV